MADFERIFSEIQTELNIKADKEYRDKIRDHFKMDVSNFLGVRIPLVRKNWQQIFQRDKKRRYRCGY